MCSVKMIVAIRGQAQRISFNTCLPIPHIWNPSEGTAQIFGFRPEFEMEQHMERRSVNEDVEGPKEGVERGSLGSSKMEKCSFCVK